MLERLKTWPKRIAILGALASVEVAHPTALAGETHESVQLEQLVTDNPEAFVRYYLQATEQDHKQKITLQPYLEQCADLHMDVLLSHFTQPELIKLSGKRPDYIVNLEAVSATNPQALFGDLLDPHVRVTIEKELDQPALFDHFATLQPRAFLQWLHSNANDRPAFSDALELKAARILAERNPKEFFSVDVLPTMTPEAQTAGASVLLATRPDLVLTYLWEYGDNKSMRLINHLGKLQIQAAEACLQAELAIPRFPSFIEGLPKAEEYMKEWLTILAKTNPRQAIEELDRYIQGYPSIPSWAVPMAEQFTSRIINMDTDKPFYIKQLKLQELIAKRLLTHSAQPASVLSYLVELSNHPDATVEPLIELFATTHPYRSTLRSTIRNGYIPHSITKHQLKSISLANSNH